MTRWPIVSLGDITETMKNGIYKPSSSYAEDGVACLRMYNIDRGGLVWRDIKRMRLSEEELADYELIPGDLLVNRVNSRELVGKTTVIPQGLERLVFESKNIRLRLKRELALPKFVNYQLLFGGQRHFSSNAQQVVGMASISQKQLADFPIVLPSLSDQERVVAEIDKQFSRLDGAVANLKRVKANLKRYKAAVLKAAVEGRLVETEAELASREGRSYETGAQLLQRILETRRSQWKGKRKYKEPVAPDISGLPTLQEGWVWCGFEQVSVSDKHALKAGPFGSALKKEMYVKAGYKIYGQEQVISGDPTFGDYFLDEEKYRELVSCAVKPGDLLISLVGTAGKVLVLPSTALPGIINPRLLKLSLNKAFIVPEYASYLLQSAWARSYFKLQAHGGTMEILNLGIIKALPVPLPPIDEQTRIVAEIDRRFSLLREIEGRVDVNLRRTDFVRKSILQIAFNERKSSKDIFASVKACLEV